MTDRVVISSGLATAVFRSAFRDRSDDPYAAGSLVLELHCDGLDAIQSVLMFSFDWDSLADFFSDLADSWRGWDGEKSWESIEPDLAITATSDRLGHCIFSFTLQNGQNQTWKTTVRDVSIGAGEDMAAVARDFRSWVDGA